MDSRTDQRPPRAARPASRPASAAVADHNRTSLFPSDSKTGVSFNNVEQGDRNASLDGHRQRHMPSAYQPHLNDPELSDQFDPTKFGRKKSLVRPDREKIDPGHRQWHYRSHVAQLEEEGRGRVGVMPSCGFLVACAAYLCSFFM